MKSSTKGNLPDPPELISFSWSQSHSNADKCFCISFGGSEYDNPAGHYLNCEFMNDDEWVTCCDVPIDNEQWRMLETLLRAVQLPAYSSPEQYLMDATNSQIRIIWKENESKITARYNGEYAHELFNAIAELALELSEKNRNAD